MRIGFTELMLVFVVALVVIGPEKLPQYAKKFGEALASFRKAADEATEEIRKNVVEPLDEAQRPLREAMEPVEDLNRAVRKDLREVQTSLRQVGKTPPASSAKSGAEKEQTAAEPPEAETLSDPAGETEETEGGEP